MPVLKYKNKETGEWIEVGGGGSGGSGGAIDAYTKEETDALLKGALTTNEDGIFITESNIVAHYLHAQWLQTTADTHMDEPAEKIAVLDGSGWIYHRTPAEALSDMGGVSKDYVDTAIQAAIGNAIGGSY